MAVTVVVPDPNIPSPHSSNQSPSFYKPQKRSDADLHSQHVQLSNHHAIQSSQTLQSMKGGSFDGSVSNVHSYKPGAKTSMDESIVYIHPQHRSDTMPTITSPSFHSLHTMSTSDHAYDHENGSGFPMDKRDNTISDREEEPHFPQENPSWTMAIFWFLFNTFDLFTDVKVGITWVGGYATTQDPVREYCSLREKNLILLGCGLVMLACAMVGYGFYLWYTWRQIVIRKPKIMGWNWPKIGKLMIEDFVSIVIQASVTLTMLRMTYWTAISIGMSILSFTFMMAKWAIYHPCKHGKKKSHKWGSCLCCLLWLLTVGGLALILLLLYIELGGVDAPPRTPDVRFVTRNSKSDGGDCVEVPTIVWTREIAFEAAGIWCYYEWEPIQAMVCMNEDLDGTIEDLYESFLTENGTLAIDLNGTIIVEYGLCDSMLDGNEGANTTICYGSMEPKIDWDIPIVSDVTPE